MSENFVIYFDGFKFTKVESEVFIEGMIFNTFEQYNKYLLYEFREKGFGYFSFLNKRKYKKILKEKHKILSCKTLQKINDLSEELKQIPLETQTIEGSIEDCDDLFSGKESNYTFEEN